MTVHTLNGLLLGLLMIITQYSTGVTGEDSIVYSSVGDNTSLPCHIGAFPSCHNIFWIYSKLGLTVSHVLVNDGKVEQKSGKLRAGPDCSLQVNNLTTADIGQYGCRLYHNETDYTDAVLHLSILSISASSPVAELKTGATVTLLCQLHSDGPCRKSLRVTWVSETGIPLQGDRYTTSESQNSSSLTVTLERSDRNRKWRCQLTEKGKLMTSHSYTTVFPGGISLELAIRLTVFFVLLIIPPLIGTIFHIKRRNHKQRDTSGLSVDFINTDVPDTNVLPEPTSRTHFQLI